MSQNSTLNRFLYRLMSPLRMVGFLTRSPRALGLGLQGIKINRHEYRKLILVSLAHRKMDYVFDTVLPSVGILFTGDIILSVATHMSLVSGLGGYVVTCSVLWLITCVAGVVNFGVGMDGVNGWYQESVNAIRSMKLNARNMPASLCSPFEHSYGDDKHIPEVAVYRALGGRDTLGMIRLSLAMARAQSSARRLEMDGETSELLARVGEALADEHARSDPTLLRLSVMDGLQEPRTRLSSPKAPLGIEGVMP